MLGAGSAYDRRFWTFSARRARRLRSLHSRLVAASRKTIPHYSVMAGSLAFPLGGAACSLTAAGWPRDVVPSAIVASPLSPGGAAFLKMLLEGGLARGGPFHRLEEQGGIAVKLDWALISVLPNLAVDSDCITLGLFAAGVPIGGRDAFISCALGPRAKGQIAREFQARGREGDGL